MAQAWKSWEMLLEAEIFVDSLVWESVVLGLVSFHLSNKVDKMLWLLEEFKLFGIDQISEFIFNLNDELNNIETIKSVIGKARIQCN